MTEMAEITIRHGPWAGSTLRVSVASPSYISVDLICQHCACSPYGWLSVNLSRETWPSKIISSINNKIDGGINANDLLKP